MSAPAPANGPNRLFFGDNLDILRQQIADASVDLVYLDPPFNSNVNYNILFREPGGEQSAAVAGSPAGFQTTATGFSNDANIAHRTF